jgi:hypothetical protein
VLALEQFVMGRGGNAPEEYDLAEALIGLAGVAARAAAHRFERDCHEFGDSGTALLWGRVARAVALLQEKETPRQSEVA